MAQKPDFIKCHCNSSLKACCTDCQRDFTITTNDIEGIFREANNKCSVGLVNPIHPRCQDHYHFFETSISYEDMVSLLDGDVLDLGDVSAIDKSKV